MRALVLLLACLSVAAAPVDLTHRIRLDNGVEALVVPREGSPLAALLVAVRAGSRHETAATAGAAHLLEHLVFEGTEARGRDAIFRWVYGIGGYLNGFTRDDFTGYLLMGPPAELPAMARLLAELLSGARLSPDALAGVKAVVLEELRQARGRPGYAEEVRFRAARFAGTPYADPVLGTEHSIRAIALDDLQRFYRTHYTPDNMLVLAVGGASAREMTDAVRDAFGALPRSGDRPAAPPPAPRLPPGGAVVRGATDGTVRVGFLAPPPTDPAFADVLALGALLGGPASPLPRHLEASVTLATDGGVASLEVRAPAGAAADPDGRVASIVDALRRLATDPAAITPEIAHRAARHAGLEAARLAERIHYFAMWAAPLLVAGRPDLVLAEPAAPTPDALRASLARILDGGYVALVPGGEASSAPPAAPSPSPAREAAGAAHSSRLANGLTVLAETRPSAPLVAAHLLAKGRLLAEPPELPGAAEILHRALLERGLARDLAALGAEVTVADDPREPFGDWYFARDFSGVRLEALPDQAEAALARLASAVASPPEEPQAIARARSETAAVADFRATTPRTLAEDRLWARLFEGPPGTPPAGHAATFARATPEALAAFHRRYFAPSNLILSLVGPEPAERLVAMAERTFGRLAAGQGPALATPTPASDPSGEPWRVTLGTGQGYVAVGLVAEAGAPRERAALRIAVGLLGASLFSSLRDDQGLAYAVGADVAFVGPYAVVTAGLGTAPDSVDRALDEVRRLVAGRATATVTPEDVRRRAAAIRGRLASRQLASATRAYYLGVAAFRGDVADLLDSVTPAEVEAVQRRVFSRPLAAVVVE
ncbi:MAG TPA: pitrilysin family protein [Thermodesulfobacteriota bacterium]